jgi:DNA-binding response OmpR family regulator
MPKAIRVLIAEDDADIATLLAHYVQKEGWLAHVETTGSAALLYARTQPVDIAILDIMLPGLDGLSVCRALRTYEPTARLPVIIVTAKGEEADRITGLEIGADDYVTKPFSPNELVARIRAVLRRSESATSAASVLVFGPLTMDLSRHTVKDRDRDVMLTAKEFLLLQYFLEHRGRVLSRDVLLSDVWGYQYTGGTRTVDVHVRRLREKLPLLSDALVTVKQFGYKLEEPITVADGRERLRG